jgi:hypothetical protein
MGSDTLPSQQGCFEKTTFGESSVPSSTGRCTIIAWLYSSHSPIKCDKYPRRGSHRVQAFQDSLKRVGPNITRKETRSEQGTRWIAIGQSELDITLCFNKN